MTQQEAITIDIIPTIFPDYNVKNNLAAEHKTTSLTIKRLKHGHLRAIQRIPEADQIHYLMTELSGLTQNDLDELDVEDSAKLSEVIYGFMKRFAEIAKQMR
jgi:hypothetical protein